MPDGNIWSSCNFKVVGSNPTRGAKPIILTIPQILDTMLSLSERKVFFMSEEYENRQIPSVELHGLIRKWEAFEEGLDQTPNPEEFLLGMFGAMEAEKLPLYQLLLWGTLCGSASEDTTQRVLVNLVDMQVIGWEKDDEGTTWFSLVQNSKDQIQ